MTNYPKSVKRYYIFILMIFGILPIIYAIISLTLIEDRGYQKVRPVSHVYDIDPEPNTMPLYPSVEAFEESFIEPVQPDTPRKEMSIELIIGLVGLLGTINSIFMSWVIFFTNRKAK